jgi:hypothetical protein
MYKNTGEFYALAMLKGLGFMLSGLKKYGWDLGTGDA